MGQTKNPSKSAPPGAMCLPRAWGCSWVQRLCWQLGLHFPLGSRKVNKQNVYIQAPCPDPTWRCRTTSLPAATWPSPAGITPWGGRKAFCLWDVSGRRDTGRGQQVLERCSAGCSSAFYGFGPGKLISLLPPPAPVAFTNQLIILFFPPSFFP